MHNSCGPRHAVRKIVVQGSAVVRAPLEVHGREWLMTCVSMGNPHAVTFGTQGADVKARASSPHAVPKYMPETHYLNRLRGCLQVDDLDLPVIGPVFERHKVFPARINTEFVEVSSAAPVLGPSDRNTAQHGSHSQ